MKVRLYLDIDSDSELARNIMEAWKRATFPGSAATGFYADGVFYGIAPGGVCVELNQYTHEVPTPYQGMVTSVEITGYIEPTDVITRGTYRRRSSNGSVERFMMGRKTWFRIDVTGKTLRLANRLFDDIRTSKAQKALRVQEI